MSAVLPTMLCVVALISSINAIILVIVSMLVCISSACTSMLAVRSCIYLRFMVWRDPLRLSWAGIVLNSMGLPLGRVIAWTLPIPGTRKTALAILSITRKSAALRKSWSLSMSSNSGFIRAAGKCRSAAAYPSFAGRSAGR
jgi:hypothetical protein